MDDDDWEDECDWHSDHGSEEDPDERKAVEKLKTRLSDVDLLRRSDSLIVVEEVLAEKKLVRTPSGVILRARSSENVLKAMARKSISEAQADVQRRKSIVAANAAAKAGGDTEADDNKDSANSENVQTETPTEMEKPLQPDENRSPDKKSESQRNKRRSKDKRAKKQRTSEEEAALDAKIARIRKENQEREERLKLIAEENKQLRAAEKAERAAERARQREKAQREREERQKKEYEAKRAENIRMEEENQKAIAKWEEKADAVAPTPKTNKVAREEGDPRAMMYSSRGRGARGGRGGRGGRARGRGRQNYSQDVSPSPKGKEMTPREKAEHEKWLAERKRIDEERLARHQLKQEDGSLGWKRSWDTPEHKLST